MIYYREGLDKDGKVVTAGGITRHASCWGLFEDTVDSKKVVLYRLAVYSPTGLARVQQEAFAHGRFVQELTDNMGFSIVGFDDHTMFAGPDTKKKNWTSSGWVLPIPATALSGFAILEFNADIPADRVITACRLLTSYKYYTENHVKAVPEKLYQFAPLLLQLPYSNGEITSDSYSTLVPVTAQDVRDLNDGDMLNDWDDDNDDGWGDFVRQYKETHLVLQTHESILEILQRDSAEFGKWSSQQQPIREGYQKDDSLYYDDSAEGILTISAPICNTPQKGQTPFVGSADLYTYLLKHL